jgi:hypothetical protein
VIATRQPVLLYDVRLVSGILTLLLGFGTTVSEEQIQKIMKEFGSHNYQYGLNKEKFADIMEKYAYKHWQCCYLTHSNISSFLTHVGDLNPA